MPAPRPTASAASNVPADAEEGDVGLNRLIDQKYASDPAKAKDIKAFAVQIDAQLDAEEKLTEFHRRTMVAPAPANFKSEPVARKIRLRLVVEKPTLRSGERPRFRLEMTNVGRETIEYSESRASFFVKNASVLDSEIMHFYLTDPEGRRDELVPKPPPHTFQPETSHENATFYLPDSMPKAEKEKWLKETNAMSRAHSTFKVKLLPGETLHSIGDDDSPIENFRTLFTRAHFDKPGIYQLQVELDDRPEPLDKEFIEFNLRTGSTIEEIHKDHDRWMKDALGPVSSNAAAVKVVQ